MREVVYTSEFVDGVAAIRSGRLLDELDRRLASIEAFPLMGTDDVRSSLTDRFGAGLRRFPVPPFVIVYRYDEKRDRIEFLALAHQKRVR